ncbi:carcinoembryonic antigen-related cell adhesion molecule 1-like [Camelus ferus]|uniref:Carcinoembryonic antigen-related cell adhesion molecule 1-like n=1 Tax=Camelus ferus TaxID=419612 RepID=A0A8B8TM09_CAMFR|nr:carcinoembryonic antigen-related cell adhesion molecule 1-like [Camelus ferus]
MFTKLPTPIITSNNSNPLEHEDTVVLTCEPETQNTTYMWWINNQSLPDSTRLELSEDNKTLTLLHVTRNDTGPYVCETQNPVSAGRSDPFTINVLCEVRAILWVTSTEFTGPQEWLRSLRKECGPRPQTSHLLCFFADPVAQPSIQASNTTVTEHGDTVFLTCLTNDTGISISWLFNGQSLLLTERMKLSQGNSTLTIHPVRREDAGNYQCQVSNLGYSSKSDVLSLDVTYDSTQGSSSGLSDGAIASIVIGAVAALVYFLYIRNTGRSGTF